MLNPSDESKEVQNESKSFQLVKFSKNKYLGECEKRFKGLQECLTNLKLGEKILQQA